MTVPILAITMGDPAGVGPEVLVKAFARLPDFERASLLVIGNVNCLEQACLQTRVDLSFTTLSLAGIDLSRARLNGAASLEIKNRLKSGLASLSQSGQSSKPILVLEPQAFVLDGFQQGRVSAEGGKAAVVYFETAVKLALGGLIQGVVTCPINKAAVHAAGYVNDIGHQEILGRMCGAELTATMLMTKGLKVAHLSTHKSLAQAVAYVKRPILVEKLKLTVDHLRTWSGREPKIAVAALNPHGGELGMLGQEEIDEIAPAIAECRAAGLDVVGPYPADSVFYRAASGQFDAVMALYHDQGHIAIKMHNFEESITATMGISFVRTSVDHGTAFDIAGQNLADANGLMQAIHAAVDMLNGKLA